MRFILYTLLSFFITIAQLQAAVGIFNHSATVNNTLRNSGTNLGSFAPNGLILNGGGATSWQNGGDDVCTVYLDYAVTGGGPSGTITLSYTGPGAGADKNWSNTAQSINISNLPNGNYTLTTNYRIMGRFGGVTCFGSTNEFNTSSLANLSFTFTVNSALPVTLTKFNAQIKSRSVELNWSTAQEVNSSHFNIERSANGVDWKTIGRTEAQNMSFDLQNYQFTDHQPEDGKNYYRLKQVDVDGKFDYSPAVIARTNSRLATNIYPNPVIDVLSIQTEEVALVELFDTQGRLTKTWMTNEQINLADQTPGIYQLRITLHQFVETRTILKQ